MSLAVKSGAGLPNSAASAPHAKAHNARKLISDFIISFQNVWLNFFQLTIATVAASRNFRERPKERLSTYRAARSNASSTVPGVTKSKIFGGSFVFFG